MNTLNIRSWKVVFICILCLVCFVSLLYAGESVRGLMIVEKGDVSEYKINFMGKISFGFGKDRKLTPHIWVSGNVVVFRVGTQFEGSYRKAGFAYKVNDKLQLEEMCPVDLTLSYAQLEELFCK